MLNFSSSVTVLSVLEVLFLLVPVLLSVAFVTIAERKTMASMQRRLGPNTVGYYGLLQAFKKKSSFIRYYHTSTQNKLITNLSDLYTQKPQNNLAKSAIEEILNYRKTRFDIPLREYTDKKIITCSDISDKLKRLATPFFFIKKKGVELGKKAGIYTPSFFIYIKFINLGSPLCIQKTIRRRLTNSLLHSTIKGKGGELISVREFNTLSEDKLFKEWLCGFIDSEGTFFIKSENGGSSYRFNFQIGLHIDDSDVLHFINRKLGIGQVRNKRNEVIYTVCNQPDVVILINILSKYTLNTKKYFEFEDFKRAFELYTNSKKTPELKLAIKEIKDGMNKGRTNFYRPEKYEYRITPNWLQGFVEGDGSFFIRRIDYLPVFTIVQHSVDLELMNKIVDFLYDLLPTCDKEKISKTSIRISESIVTKGFSLLSKESSTLKGLYNKKSIANLLITRSDLIKCLIIPFFSSLTWHTKKLLDFEDFIWVFKLKDQGHHHSVKGKILIDSFLNQMNNNRLSTSGKSKGNRELLIKQAKLMLDGPSNYKIEEGKIWIISENKWLPNRKPISIVIRDIQGNFIERFPSVIAAMNFLNVSRYIINERLVDGKPFLWTNENKWVYVKKDLGVVDL
jgi:hypothetical protein